MREDHPLWRFFDRQRESITSPNRAQAAGARSWTAFELRLKSFDDLHTLWYVCLRERNRLFTEREEMRRMRLDFVGYSFIPEQLRKVSRLARSGRASSS